MKRAASSILVATLAVMTLAGCQNLATRSTSETASDALTEEQYRRYLDNFKVDGKIALRAEDERATAFFNWEQKKGNYVISLYGPFGRGATYLRRTTKGVTLENAEHGYVGAPDAESLMRDVLGWQVPITGLQYWVRGLADPSAEITSERFDDEGFRTHLEQQGWSVTFKRPRSVNGWQLPGRLDAERDGMKVVMVLSDWDVPLAPGAKYTRDYPPPPRTY